MSRIDVSAPTSAIAPSLADPARFLPSPTRPCGPDRWLVPLSVGPFRHEAVVTVGPMWRTDGRTGRSVQWAPAVTEHDVLPYEALMPAVHGVLVLEAGQVHLQVHYSPVAGVLGRVVDVVLRPVARASVARFARDIADAMAASPSTTTGGR